MQRLSTLRNVNDCSRERGFSRRERHLQRDNGILHGYPRIGGILQDAIDEITDLGCKCCIENVGLLPQEYLRFTIWPVTKQTGCVAAWGGALRASGYGVHVEILRVQS